MAGSSLGEARAQGTASAGDGDGDCPTTAAVWSGVASLIGRERLPQAEPPSTLAARDLGARYEIVIGDKRHEYADAARDCAQRAQVAAVFVALTLVPPEFLLPAAPARTPAPPPASIEPAHEPTLRLELGPWAGILAHADGNGVAPTGGAALRLAVGAGRLVAIAGVGAALPGTATLGPARVREQRFPLELGARLRWRGPTLEAGLEAAGVVTALRLGVAGGASTTVLDWGARAGAILAFGNRPVVPFVALFADMSFAPRGVAFAPTGEVGRTSWLRAGVALGVAWRFR